MRTDERRNMGWLDWDEFAKDYDGVFLRDPVYTRMLEMVLEQVEDVQGKRVLDLGCGTGNLTYHLLRRAGGVRVLGVDPSSEMRKLFADRFAGEPDVTVAEGVSTGIPSPDAEFDYVLTSLVLHHVPREEKAACAAELARVLKPGGRLLYADRFCDIDGPAGDPGRARDVIEKMTGWALYCLDHGAREKALLILESIPNDLRENGEYVVTAGAWNEHLTRAGFSDLAVTDVPPAEFGLKVLTAKRG